MRRLLAADGDAATPADDAFRRRPGSAACARRSFAAGQSLVLVRLAADCGARRGELAVLRRLSDLDGRVLTIERSLSAGFPGPVKSGRTRRVILGYRGHDPAPLPRDGGPAGAGAGPAVQPVATAAGP